MASSGYVQYSRFHENPYSTDHWSKMKVKSLRLQQLPTGQYAVLCAPRVPPAKRRHSLDLGELQSSNTLARIGSAQLNRQLDFYLPPVQLTRKMSIPTCGIRQDRISSASNERARRGFKFWPQDKPSSTTHGTKVTMGSKGTFFGLGVPRL